MKRFRAWWTLGAAILLACGSETRQGEPEAGAVAPEAAIDDAAISEAGEAAALDSGGEEAGPSVADASDALDAAPHDVGPPDVSDSEAGAPALTISVAEGALRGKFEHGARLFLAVPYAAPPVGALRFALPVPARSWQGVRAAGTHGPSCIQPPDGTDGPTAEDCLTLDVYTPMKVTAPLPVMVFLHGGAFAGGGAHTFAAQWLSAGQDVVVVTVNYRLGALGLLVDPALDAALGVPSGNLALRDQQQALRWLRDNVAAFGGDRTRITLFGQSAGAISTCLHLFARGSEGLAQRFLMQSGTCIEGGGAPLTRAQIVERSAAYIQLRCPDQTTRLSCLRSLPAASLTALSIAEDFLVSGFYPYVDGSLLPGTPRELVRRGELHAGEILLGTNLSEFDLPKTKGSLLPEIPNQLALRFLIATSFPDDADAVLALYARGSDAEAHAAYVRLSVDKDQRCPSRALARATSARGYPTYLYSFEVAPAVHAMELDYVFGWPEGGVSQGLTGAPYPLLRSLVGAVQRYWTRFARSGDTNVASGSQNDGSTPTWPAFNEAGAYLTLAEPIRSASTLYGAECDFWDAYYARQR
jgi:para-nitrobenzyl esterase